MLQKKTSKIWKKMYCSNCGKFNHKYKDCREPISSMGIINIGLDEKNYNLLCNLSEILKNSKKKINIKDFNNNNLKDLRCIFKFKKLIKFLMIRRKHSLNYIEFIRGRYEINDKKKIREIFSLMTKIEINKIINNSFDFLWDDLWEKTSKAKQFEKEYLLSKQKFEKIFKNKKFINSLTTEYLDPEWGFPKGRRNNFESNFETAVREFTEETNINKDNYIILKWIKPIEEVYVGTNNITYKHIYYIAISKNNIKFNLDEKNIHQKNEISDMGLFTYNKCTSLVRSYYNSKKNIISQLYIFICTIINKINNNDQENLIYI